MTQQLTAAQQAQVDNRDASGQFTTKAHGDVENTADVLGIDDDTGAPQPLSMSPNRDRSEPKVWLGSAGDHASGELVGDWYAAEYAEDVTVADLHRAAGTQPGPDSGEEIAVMDHEGLDIGSRVSLSASKAVELSQNFDIVESSHGSDGVEVYKAMIRDQGFDDYTPSPDEFINSYAGDYASAENYVEGHVRESVPDVATAGQLDEFSGYIKTARLERDLEIKDPGIDYDDLNEIMEHIDVESVAEQIREDNGDDSSVDLNVAAHQQVEEWVADGDEDAIDQHIETPDYEAQAQAQADAWVAQGDGESIKENFAYEDYTRDLKLSGRMTFLEKNDGAGGVHAFRAC